MGRIKGWLVSILSSAFLWAAQPEATTGVEGTPSASGPLAGGAGGGAGGCAQGSMQLIMFPVIFALFYFLLIRPQQKKQQDTDSMLKALRKGDKVRTTGGIKGEILSLDEREVVLQIADKVKINVLRTHIANKDDATGSDVKGES